MHNDIPYCRCANVMSHVMISIYKYMYGRVVVWVDWLLAMLVKVICPASSSHSPTGPPLATEPLLLLFPRSGTVCQCHRRSHQRHHWTSFAGVWRLVCSPCHIQTYSYRNWLTSVSGPCSNFYLGHFKNSWLIDCVSRAWPDWCAVLCCWISKCQSRWPQSVGAGAPGGTG